MNKLIGVSGKMQAGKDEFGRIFLNSYPDYTLKKFAYKVKLVASVLTGIPIEKFEDDSFKNSYLGDEWNTVTMSLLQSNQVIGQKVKTVKKMTVRSMLQLIGTDAMRLGLHPNVWVNALFADISPNDKILITDVRFPNEANRIREEGGIIIRINRPDELRNPLLHKQWMEYRKNNNDYTLDYSQWMQKYEAEQYKKYFHESETALDSYNFDYTIWNGGHLEAFTLSCNILLKNLTKNK